MAIFEPVINSQSTVWINQSSFTDLIDEKRDEFIVELPSYDTIYDSSPIYLLNSELKDTYLDPNFTITAIEFLNDTDQFNNNLSNISSKFESFSIFLQGQTVTHTLYILLAIFLYTLSLLTLLGNGIVIYAIATERKLRTVSNMFILSLAIADLIVGAIVMPISSTYVLTHDWIFGRAICQFWIITDYSASTASILNILILSLDRYWSIKNPLQYLRKRTKKRALAMICIVWLLSLSWCFPILFWHTWFSANGLRKHPESVCEVEFSDSFIFKLSSSFVNFIVPICLMSGLYAKIFLEIKRRGKLNIGRYSSNDTKSSTKMSTSNQQNIDDQFSQNNPDSSTKQTSIKQTKSFKLKERLSEKLSFKEEKLKKGNSIKEVSFSAKNLNDRKNSRTRATWNCGTNVKRKMVLVECSKNNQIPKVDLCIECDQNDQITSSIAKNKDKEIEESNNSNCDSSSIEKVEKSSIKNKGNEDKKNDESKISNNDNETVIDKQKYQQLTILDAGNQLKELKTLDNVKVEVQIIASKDSEQEDTEQETDKEKTVEELDNQFKDQADVKESSSKNSNESLNLIKSKSDENTNDSQKVIQVEKVDIIEEEEVDRDNNKISAKKWFLLPKVTVYLQKNLQLDKKRKKGKQSNRKLNKDRNFEISLQEDDEDISSLSIRKYYKDNEIVNNLNSKNVNNESFDSFVDKNYKKEKKKKAFRSLLWLRKSTFNQQKQQSNSYQTNSNETTSGTPSLIKRRIENDETGSLSFDFSSSIPRYSLEDLHAQTSGLKSSMKQTQFQNHLLPFSCSSNSLRINKSSLNLRNQQTPNDTSPVLRASLINRTLNKTILAKSTTNLPASKSVNLSNNKERAHFLSTNNRNSQQPAHSLSLHLPSTSSTSVNQNSLQTNSSDYMGSQSNQSSFYLSRIESSRLRQEKKAALQLGLIMGGFLICWLPYILVYIMQAQCLCIDSTTHTIAIWLGYLNSSLNPVLYFMGPNSSRFKQAARKLLFRKSIPRYLIDQKNGKIPNQLLTAPGIQFNTTLTTNSLNQKTIHTRLSRTTSNRSQTLATKDDFSKFRRNKALNCSLREINNNTIS